MIRSILRLHILAISACFGLLCSCSKPAQEPPVGQGFAHSNLLSMDTVGGYPRVRILDPWGKTDYLGSYILVPQEDSVPSELTNLGTIVRVPIQNALVHSSVHVAAIHTLTGSYDAITGVLDAPYYQIDSIRNAIANGTVIDCGTSQAPTAEAVIGLEPEVVILSPFMNAGHGILTTLGMPIIECADYMEPTPLGRAEWIKLFGMLTGTESKADSLFEAEHERYETLRAMVANCDEKPKIISEIPQSGVWFVPGGKSYMALLFKDAGATYPWADNESSGSLQLDFAQVYEKAHDASVWLIRSYGDTETILKSMENAPEIGIDAWTEGNIYVCDTSTSSLYSDFPFEPSLFLKELVNILHPGMLEDSTLLYFKKYHPKNILSQK